MKRRNADGAERQHRYRESCGFVLIAAYMLMLPCYKLEEDLSNEDKDKQRYR